MTTRRKDQHRETKPFVTQKQVSQVEREGGDPATHGPEEFLESDLLSSTGSPEPPQNRPQTKRCLPERCKAERPTKIPRNCGSNSSATFDPSESALPAPLDGDLCSRCKTLNINITDETYPSFKVVTRLGDVKQLLNNPDCRLCRLLHKVRPVSSDCDAGGCSDCSLVRFDGKWARPWKVDPSMKSAEGSLLFSIPGICSDTFARMDNEIMFGVLPSKGVEVQRSNTTPYLHDRLYEILTRSGYIRVLRDPSLVGSEKYGPNPVRSNVEWEFLRSCISECAFHHSGTCESSFGNDYKPLKVIDCWSREVVKFSHNAKYLALSYIWGSEQSDVCATNDGMLPNDVPTTISDAMEATLKLQFQFLWVDRYCIPQDQDAIKHREIRHMDMIYRGAAATIVACAGMSPWYGLPGCSSRPRSGSDRIAIRDQVFFSVPPDPRYEIEASNWMTRGWTYQEGVLSRRRIFFTEEQVYFECDSRHCFESTAPLLNEVLWRASQKARIFSIAGKATSRHDFYNTINEYSGRELTYESDILNGVWGVLRTFQNAKYPICHYWGVPVYGKQCSKQFDKQLGYDYLAGFAWDLVRPAQRRDGFPSWSWSGWIGQVKPELLVKLEHAPTHSQVNFTKPLEPVSLISPPIRESNPVETPQDILQINLPDPVEEDINLWARRIDGSLFPYLDASLQYSNSGGLGLSRFIHIAAWMTPATLSTSGRPKVTIAPPPRQRSPFDPRPLHESLAWLPTTIDEIISPGPERPDRPCESILLATREPLVVKRRRGVRGLPILENEDDLKEGEVVNNSWLCLFLVVEHKVHCFERIGLAKFLFSEKMSMQALIQDLNLQKQEIRLG